MKFKYTKILALFGLLAIVILQTLWLYNIYVQLADIIYKESNNILIKSIRREISIRFKKAPKGTEITSVGIPINKKKNELAPEIVDLNEGLAKLGFGISLVQIDSIATILLEEANIESSIVICKINPYTKKITETSNANININSLGIIKSKIISINTDSTQGIQMVLINPYYTIIKRMALLMISSVLTMILIIGCIVYLTKTITRLNKISQLREDFSNAMIHDMKTPLSTIMMSLNFLHNPKLDEKPEMKNKFLNIAESEADHLLTLTNKILTISKLENKRLEMNKSKVALPPIIEKLTEKFSAKSVKPIHFIIDLKAEEIYADKEYLEEVISNLIDNAIKYSKESVEIKISSYDNDVNTIIKVHDNGLGIPQKYQLTIFNKYERGAASKRTRKNGSAGFGLGLNFVYQVITAHEGNIFVNSIEGEFTEFIISLPQIIQKL
nr:HAMP domain-containing sensor histidine kinase [uncultured Bacteroides sp.]